MKKVKKLDVVKIWGVEHWVYSPLAGRETELEDGQKTKTGPLIKIIEANEDLSVQVHPDDAMAQKVEHEPNGKTESWYVLAARPNAKVVVGLRNYDRKTILDMLKDKTFSNDLLTINPQPKQFINIPSGLVHALGGGIKVLEVQQPSATTYRYFDYDRLEKGKPRELHVEKALQAQKDLSYKLEPVSKKPLTYQTPVATQMFFERETYFVKDKAIVVDLEKYEAYIAENEQVKFNWYAVISF